MFIYAFIGKTITTAMNGVLKFNNDNSIVAYCFPGGNMTLTFEAQLSGLDISRALTIKSILTFRKCVDGEFLQENQCKVCPEGSYSVEYIDENTRCNPCPINSIRCYGNIVIVSTGFWRISPYASTILECPYGRTACIGGTLSSEEVTDPLDIDPEVYNPPPPPSGLKMPPFQPPSLQLQTTTTTSSSQYNRNRKHRRLDEIEINNLKLATTLCAPGYQGPLCAVCYTDYYFALVDRSCVSCEGKGLDQLMLLIMIPLTLILLSILFIFNMRRVLTWLEFLDKATKSFWKRLLIITKKRRSSRIFLANINNIDNNNNNNNNNITNLNNHQLGGTGLLNNRQHAYSSHRNDITVDPESPQIDYEVEVIDPDNNNTNNNNDTNGNMQESRRNNNESKVPDVMSNSNRSSILPPLPPLTGNNDTELVTNTRERRRRRSSLRKSITDLMQGKQRLVFDIKIMAPKFKILLTAFQVCNNSLFHDLL